MAAFLGKFRAPVLAVPGNHDIDRFNVFGRLCARFAPTAATCTPELDRSLPLPGAHVVGLASPSRWTMDLGYVSRAQIEWADDALSGAASDAVRVLVVHHAPRPPRVGHWLRSHLRGRRLERLLFQSGVNLVLTGHNHFPYAEQMSCQESGSGVLWLQAGTATCWRINRRTHSNSFTVIRAHVDRLEVAWWYYADQLRAFEATEAKVFPRGARRRPPARAAGTPALATP